MQKIEYMEDFYNRPINIGELRALGEDGWILCQETSTNVEHEYLFYRVVEQRQNWKPGAVYSQ